MRTGSQKAFSSGGGSPGPSWRKSPTANAAAALVGGALGVIGGSTAIWLALGLGVAALAVQGVRYSRLESLSKTGTTVVVGLNLVLGLTIVVLKVLVVH